MRRHLRIVCSSGKEKESISKKRSVQSMLSRSNDAEITKRDALPNRRRRVLTDRIHRFARSLSTEGKRRERKRGSGKREKMRHINHINHLSGLHHHHHQKKKKKTTTRIRDNEKKRQRENATTREEDSFFNPTSDGSSQRRTHGTLFLVCLVVREECGTKNSRFSPQKSKKTHKN